MVRRQRGALLMARGGGKSYLWCAACRRSYTHADAPDGRCPVCSGPTREMSRFAAIARGLMANELTTSDFEARHRLWDSSKDQVFRTALNTWKQP